MFELKLKYWNQVEVLAELIVKPRIIFDLTSSPSNGY